MRRSLRVLPIALQNITALGLVFTAVGCGGSATSKESGAQDSGTSLQTVVDSGGAVAVSEDAGSEDAGTSDDAATAPDTSFSDDGGVGVIAVPLLECEGFVYTASMTIGGSQTFQMLVDTGSTTLGVAATVPVSTPDAGPDASPQYDSCTTCNVSPLYQPGAAAADQDQTAQSTYGSGSWSGEVYQDSIGFSSDPTIPLKFVAITTQSDFFQPAYCGPQGVGYEGIIGLDRANAELPDTNAFFDQYYKAKGIANIFSTELCDSSGTLWLGGWDPTVFTAGPTYVPVTKDIDSSYYYTVGLTSITVAGGKPVAIASTSYADSVVDTGTNSILLPSAAVTALGSDIAATAGYKSVFGGTNIFAANATVPCGAEGKTKAEIDAALPALTLTFGKTTVQALASESYLAQLPVSQTTNSWCSEFDPIEAGELGPGIAAILGSPLLRSNVVIFDRANSRIGFAPHKACD